MLLATAWLTKYVPCKHNIYVTKYVTKHVTKYAWVTK